MGVSLVMAVILAASLGNTGCAHQSRAQRQSREERELRNPNGRSGLREVEDARRSIEAGDTTVVVPRLLHVISNNPGSAAALDARYWLAVTYEKISSYRDAMDMLNEYLRIAPDGRYAGDARERLTRLQSEYKARFVTEEEINAQVADLSAKVAADPNNDRLQLELANTLWKRGDYDNAAKIYMKVVAEHPEHAEDKELKDRIERLPTGGFIVLTPGEVQRREVERQPLVVINTAAFRTGKDLITREDLYYVVTGQVVNRGSSVLYGVQVVTTIYGFGNMVYDTNTVNFARLSPGEIRAFSVRFSNFVNIDDIHRYDCTVMFER